MRTTLFVRGSKKPSPVGELITSDANIVGADSISARLFWLNRLHTGHVGISQAMQNLLRKYLGADPYRVWR